MGVTGGTEGKVCGEGTGVITPERVGSSRESCEEGGVVG